MAYALVIVVLAALAVGGILLVRLLRDELARLRAESGEQLAGLAVTSGAQLAERSAEVDRRLAAVVETMDRRLAELDTKVDRRLESASHASTRIHERLGKLDEATVQMNERARELGRLEQALRPPKARGGFGEMLLANLLADTFPADALADDVSETVQELPRALDAA